MHLLTSQLMRSRNGEVYFAFLWLIMLPSLWRAATERRRGKKSARLIYVLDGCCEQIDTELAFFQLGPSPVCVSGLLSFGTFRHRKYWWVVCCSQAKYACKLLPGTSKCKYKTLGDCLCSLSQFKYLCHPFFSCCYNNTYS